MKMDTEHVFHLITCDPTYAKLLEDLTHEEAMKAVVESINLLHSPGPKKDEVLSCGGCMIVSVIQQLFIRLLTKRLMNLMTAEAVILSRNRIPGSYLNNYLSNQSHFSLKDTIETMMDTVK